MTEIEKLYREMDAFFARLWPGENRPLVFGDGRAESPRLVLIGEAPGEKEVIEKRPFVGKAGKNLDEFLNMVQLCRTDIYVTNVVKVRPTKPGKSGRVTNRAPDKEELLLFTPWLKKELSLLSPKALVSLGNVPLRALTEDDKITIGDVHGTWLTAKNGLPLYALYHPASVIYRRELKEVYTRDVLALYSYLKQNDN